MLRLMLYKVQKNDGHHFDDIIYWYQRLVRDPDPIYIHGELGFDDGLMFSSSGRKKNPGTRFVSSDVDLEKWDISIIKCTKEQEIRTRKCAEGMIGLKYDWLGVLGMPSPLLIQDPNRWWCIEAINHAAAYGGIVKPNRKLRPGQCLQSYREQGII